MAGAFANSRPFHHISVDLGRTLFCSAASSRALERRNEIPIPLCRRPTMCGGRLAVWSARHAWDDFLGHFLSQRRIRRLWRNGESGVVLAVGRQTAATAPL